jgi:plastocyanin
VCQLKLAVPIMTIVMIKITTIVLSKITTDFTSCQAHLLLYSRENERRKIMMNRFACLPSLLVTVSLAALLTACSGSKEGESNGDGTAIIVEVNDFSISLATSQIEAGRMTFVVDNNGSTPHDFAVRGKGVEYRTPMVEPGKSATLTADLEPGTYTYICTVPGHEELGMRGNFNVILK